MATRQHGVVSWEQLERCGVTRGSIPRWCARARLHLVHPGVYAVGHTSLGVLGRVHAALVRKGAPSGRWAAGGVRLEVRDVAATLASASGRRVVPVPVPDSLLLLGGRANDLLRLRTPLTRAAMEYYTRMPPSDNAPVERELGVAFRDPRETLADTVAGLRAIGRL